MSGTEEGSKSPPVSLATGAAWRRLQEACSEVVSPADDKQHANGCCSLPDNMAAGPTATELCVNGHTLPDHEVATDTDGAATSDGAATRTNGLHTNGHVAPNGSANSVARGFAGSQQAAINAMISFAKPEPSAQPRPAVKADAAESVSVASPRAHTSVEVPSEAGPIIIQPSAIDQAGFSADTIAAPLAQLPTTRAQPRRERSAIWDSQILARMPALPIISILCVQAILSLRLIWSNTAFQDEALYLWAGRVEWAQWLHGTVPAQEIYDPFAAYFSGSPLIYPPLGALADSIGGLAGARVLSLCFMLVTTGLLYGVTQRIFGRSAALFGAALFVGMGSTQFLGAFATYDAMSLMLLALATWLGVRAAECRPGAQVALLVSAATAIALADAAKYAATLFDPVVIAVTALTFWRARDVKNGIGATVIMLGAVCTLILIGIRLGGPSYWHGIKFTTLTRASSTASVPGVVYLSGKWVGAVAILAVIGAAAAGYRSSRAMKALAWVLVGAVFLAPADQARIHTITSLFKHVDFGAWFCCIVAGYGLAALARAVPAAKTSAATTIGACVVVLASIAGVGFANSHFHRWPDSSRMVSELGPVLGRTGCPCLFAEGDIVAFYLTQQTWTDQFASTYYFSYPDNVGFHLLHGLPAYRQAIADHYFKLVEIDPSEQSGVYGPVTRALTMTSGYKLVGTAPSNAEHKPYEIWAYSPPAVHIPPRSHRPPRHTARRKR
jgi:hypothetical protein